MPSLEDLILPPFCVAGRVNSGEFQKAKAIAAACDASASATVLELLPTEYVKLLSNMKTEYGGPAYLHEAGVAVYSPTAGWIGDAASFIKWLDKNKVGGYKEAISSKGGLKIQWDTKAEREFQNVLCKSERKFAFLELGTEADGTLGRLVFELFEELAPKTCANFLALCEAEKGGYVGSPIHRIKPSGWLQGGDVVSGNGDSGAAASGSALPDESFQMKHSEYGLLGMAHSGKPHSATSQFYVTFAPCPSFDNVYSVFGKLIEGHKLLQFLEEMDCANGRPRANLTILAAGKVKEFTDDIVSDFYATEDEAAAKLQAMRKGQLARKEREEKKLAAKRVQAVQRGQKARKELATKRADAVAM